MSSEVCVFHGGNNSEEACPICHPVSFSKQKKAIWQGEKLRQCRKEANLTMDELSKLVGCTRALISIWEDGKSVPGGKCLILLSEVLRREPKYFFKLEVKDKAE